MSSSQNRGSGSGERMIHQDYIARIRYSNALPPPPHPPKLLDIPNTGLASGQYTAPGFASRLARDQPLNIEADAELGMALDLVGMPGVFDGDESAIQASAQPPPVDPRDRVLLRPLSLLGKKGGDAAVSFLRRTEYISSNQVKRSSAADGVFLKKPTSASLGLNRPEKRKASPEPDKGTPAWIKRRIEKSFEVAERHLANRLLPKHPSKRNVRLVDAHPLVPDLDAFPDSGAYVTIKFSTNPVGTSSTYDTRLMSGIFKPIERSAAEEAAYDAAVAAHERDPAHNPKPTNMMNYDLFLARDSESGARFRTKFDVDHPQRDDDGLYTAPEANGCFPFPRVRAYETSQETEMDHDNKYDNEVILAYRDGGSGRDGDAYQKAVYYYPVMQRSTIRNQRTKNIARTTGVVDEEEEHYDELHVRVDEPSDALKAELLRYKQRPIGWVDEDEGEAEAEVPQQEAAEGETWQEEGASPDGHLGDATAVAISDDEDAEGDEDE